MTSQRDGVVTRGRKCDSKVEIEPFAVDNFVSRTVEIPLSAGLRQHQIVEEHALAGRAGETVHVRLRARIESASDCRAWRDSWLAGDIDNTEFVVNRVTGGLEWWHI